ncbi:hypothetical protein [Sphingomonas turrisvirgatae]|uniref:Uncharacterized protein n=1 Tax=Sphingomonas turrisvirgatae TaxID=1888892 RepID=A0A1E3LTR8_9SPHN|nr:hypothetical protein [Sphingomonas turrisvirgatae]ODP37158.1 hypothetical protein BFL28_02675 [Sphingomonas turrisvirgatae]
MKRHVVILLGVVAVTLIAVVLASTTFFERPLRLYDYGTPLLAGVLTFLKLWFDARAAAHRGGAPGEG